MTAYLVLGIVLSLSLANALEESPAESLASERSDNTDYCDSKYRCYPCADCLGIPHYACKHREQKKGTFNEKKSGYGIVECPKLKAVISPTERGIILEKINDFRNKVAEGNAGMAHEGSNIRQLTWDHKLERFARIWGTNTLLLTEVIHVLRVRTRWVKICAKTKELNKTAVAVYFGSNKLPTIDDAVSSWTSTKPGIDDIGNFSEFEPTPFPVNFTTPFPTPFPPFKDKFTWTMLAWATATRTGCAFSTQICKTRDDRSTTYAVQCFVGSDVNTENQAVYNEGPACSNCPPGTQCNALSRWPKLCAQPRDPIKPGDIPDLTSSLRCGTVSILLLIVQVTCHIIME